MQAPSLKSDGCYSWLDTQSSSMESDRCYPHFRAQCENLPFHYWRYRVHVAMETLLGPEGDRLAEAVREVVRGGRRDTPY